MSRSPSLRHTNVLSAMLAAVVSVQLVALPDAHADEPETPSSATPPPAVSASSPSPPAASASSPSPPAASASSPSPPAASASSPSPPAASASSSAPRSRVPSWRTDGTWGWFVVASSVFAGSALTAMGLAIDCEGRSPGCERGSSIAIWGGVGVAAIGSILGLTVVANARDAAKPAPSPVVFRRSPARMCRVGETRP